MKHHVQNPWTRSPQVFVHFSVEEVQQLATGLNEVLGRETYDVQLPLTANQRSTLHYLMQLLQHAQAAARPHGVKGVMP